RAGKRPKRTQAWCPSETAAHGVRAGHQSQDRPGPRPDDPSIAPAAGGSGDRVGCLRAILGVSTGGLIAAPLAAGAQQAAGKVYRVGFLSPLVGEDRMLGRLL